MSRSKSEIAVRTIFIPRIIPTISGNMELSAETQAVIKLLHKYLKRAESGKTHGICITTANDDQTYDVEVAGSYVKYPSEALGPLDVLKLKLTRQALDER